MKNSCRPMRNGLNFGARARVKPSAYLTAHVGCPTEDKDFEIRHKGHRNLHNEEQVDNSCPAYVA